MYKNSNDLIPNSQEDVINRASNLSKMKDIFEFVHLNIERAFGKQSHYYNLRRRDFHFKVGDNVMKRDHFLSSGSKGFASKLAPKYSGPFVISAVVSSNIYNLRNQQNQEIKHVHIKDLKKAFIN